MAAGREATPKDAADTERLKAYWRTGPGSIKIRWGEPGDFQRCIDNIQEAVSKHGPPLPDHEVKGLCARLHKEATGATPGHAPGEEAAKKAKGR
jgi:hypothetical protein